MKWLGRLGGLIGYSLAYLKDRRLASTARNKCPHCWFHKLCDEGKGLGRGVSPLWATCAVGKHRRRLIEKRLTEEGLRRKANDNTQNAQRSSSS